MKRFIPIFIICLIAIFINTGCSTTGRLSPADQIDQIKENYSKCKDEAILKYMKMSNDLYLIKESVMADCGHYLDQIDIVFMSNYMIPPNARNMWGNRLESEIGKKYLLKQNADAQVDKFSDGVNAYRNKDYSTAFTRLMPLAEQGNAFAQVIIGHMYVNGFGVSKDIKEAVAWYRQSANQGNALGEYNLGVMYGAGAGVIQDYKEAVKWFELSAEQGNTDAQVFLGMYYGNGLGIEQDYVEAYKWLSIAGANGDKQAHEGREKAEKQMTPSQIAEAQKLVREWMEKHGK